MPDNKACSTCIIFVEIQSITHGLRYEYISIIDVFDNMASYKLRQICTQDDIVSRG